MAIRIAEDGVVIYENEPEVDRELFPNIKDNCGCQEQIDEIKKNLSELQELVGTKAEVIYETASGAIASFADGADDIPLKSCVVSIEPIQEGEGDPSPENVRPISGRTGLSVVRTGKNLLKTAGLIEGAPSNTEFSNATKRTFTVGTFVTKLTNNNYYQSQVNMQFSVSENSIKVTSSARAYDVSIPIVGLKIGETYVLSCTKTKASNNTVSFYKRDGTIISCTENLTICKFTVPEETYYTLLHFTPSENGVEATFTNIQLELGSSETDYEPYKGSTYSVNWETEAGTVYGGTIDVVSGKLTVLGVKNTLTVVNGRLQSQFFTEATEQAVTVLGNNVRISLNRISQISNMNVMSSSYSVKMANMCPHYFSYDTDTAHWYINNQLYLYLPKVDVGETIESYRTFLQDNPFEVYIQFATPTEIQLTPQEVRTLLGENNICSDGGDMEVEYPADTKMYIEKLTKPTENDMIADHAISANSFFMVGNTLYRATTAIANGATITDGTNVVKLSLSDALNELA